VCAYGAALTLTPHTRLAETSARKAKEDDDVDDCHFDVVVEDTDNDGRYDSSRRI
jgi:hypothetical protein